MNKQSGMSFFGFIIVAIVLAALAITGFRLVPVYQEYFGIKSAITRIARESAGMSPAAIRESFSKSAQISSITDVEPKDLQIIQTGGATRIVVEYEKVVPLVANISLLINFEVDESSGSSSGE